MYKNIGIRHTGIDIKESSTTIGIELKGTGMTAIGTNTVNPWFMRHLVAMYRHN